MTQKELRKELLKDPKFQEEYFIPHVGMEVQFLRKMRGLTQKQLGEMVGTPQSGIARLENDEYIPSLTFLHKVMRALHCVVKVQLIPEEKFTYGRRINH